MTATIDRAQAVKTIAGHLADCDSYVISAPPDTIATLAHNLRDLDGWTAYLDSGTSVILSTGQAAVLAITDAVISSAAVVTVPKTIPAGALSEALGQEVPADGSQDIVILHTDGPICWPLLFVDAIGVVDPRAAAQIRAAHIPHLN